MSSENQQSPDDSVLIARAFAGFGPAYFKWVQTRFAESGVSFARMRLLGALHKGGPKIMRDLSEELGVTARNVTALVDALEGEGLVRRVQHTTDRRATVIELTPTGAKYGLEMASGEQIDAIADLFRSLTPTERRQLLRLVTKLRGLLAARGFGGGGCLADKHEPEE
jgi:DNA-binding MarR family transcriptional regulator